MDDDTGDSPTLQSGIAGPSGPVAGRYHVRARLGRGASKEVYLAYDERLDREVALAIVVGAGAGDPTARARVTREAQVTGRLGDHPNVITVYDTGEHEGVPYLVLRAMTGGSLADHLANEPLSNAEAIHIGGEIAAALAHAHAHDVVHRDVKPDNVWLTGDGGAALGDFGVAQVAGAERLTADGVVVGTVRYLSPEQIRGGEAVPASDLYALGVTLYELVTGRPPFTAADVTGVLTQHLTAVPVAPSRHAPGVPPALERLILDLLAKDPAARPQSAADVAATLAALDFRPAPARRPDARRVVSVLVARAGVGDPEALHELLERCDAVIERHGGTVERFLGDGLVAIFGLEWSDGDEALRATRAAIALGAVLPEPRVGLEAGEVFLGSGPRGATIVTGAPITIAGRLADGAGAGEIHVGEQLGAAVAADAELDPDGRRLLGLRAEQPALLRPPRSPFVGRVRELEALRAQFRQACADGGCRLVTVAGAPGIGKSRLAGEFLTGLGDGATVLAGRCLARGEGTTYRAVADIVRGLGAEPRAAVEQLLAGDEAAIRGVLAAAGLAGEPAEPEETAWAVRRLLERLARDAPLVVAVEDVHWAQAPLLDLLDHVVALASGGPLLLVCLTRPELLEQRPQWAAPQANRALLVLDALPDDDARALAEGLGARGPSARIAARAEGNPLFVEQLVAVDAGDEDDELPASIQAVLAARIDRLDDGERTVLQRAAVEGRTFHAGALRALLSADEQRQLGGRLVGLARRGLLGSDRPHYAGEDAFRFTHALIREAAYSGIPKVVRTDLHAAVADWLEQRPDAEDEVVGHHLERACLLAAELGHAGDRERRLALRAVDRLTRASRGAQARGDPAACSALIERALALVAADDATRGALLPALGESLFEAGRMADAARVLDEAIADTSEPRLRARAQIEREFVRLQTETGVGAGSVRRAADAAMAILRSEHDDYGQCRAWSLRAQVAWAAGRVAEADRAWREAAACARRTGDERALFDVLGWRATAAALGPAPVDEAIPLCEQLRGRVAASPIAVAWMLNPLASLHAMQGDFEAADGYLREANETLHALGHRDASVSHHEAYVRLLAGAPEAAERLLRAGLQALAAMRDEGLLATTTALLAQAVYAQGRLDEAGELCARTAAAAARDDILTQGIWRGVRAKVLAREGRPEEGEALAREAVAFVAATDLHSHHGDAMLDLAEVLGMVGSVAEADGAARAGLALYELKGNAVAAARARSVLANRSGGT